MRSILSIKLGHFQGSRPANPFEPLYEAPFETFLEKWGPMINGLRAPDLERLFAEAGLPLACHPLDRRPEALPETIDPSWLERHDRNTLALRTALFTNGLTGKA